MPMIDAYIPHGALQHDAEKALMKKITNILLAAEGLEPTNEIAQGVSLVFLHRPEQIFVAGEPAQGPRYRFICSVPEGQLDDEKRARLVREVPDAVLEAENGAHPQSGARVWVFPIEVPEGTWGSRGKIQRLADILAYLTS